MRNIAQRDMDRRRHDGEFLRPQHHHGTICAAIMARGQRREKFRVAGMREAGGVEHMLGDRIGDERARLAANDEFHSALDRSDRCFRVRRIGRARDAANL